MFNFLKDKSLMKNLIFCLFFVSCASIASQSGGGLPFESTLESALASITGPYAKGIVIGGVIVAGGTLILNPGGSITEGIASVLKVAVYGGMCLFAAQWIYSMGGSSAQINSDLLGLI